MSWARLLKRVFDIDVEHCPHCSSNLKIIAAIEELGVIAKILAHLGLPTQAPPRHLRYASPLRLLSSQAILASRSLLGRSSPRAVFRSPRNGLISHPQLHLIRFPSRAKVPIWPTAVLHPKIRPNQRRTARFRAK